MSRQAVGSVSALRDGMAWNAPVSPFPNKYQMGLLQLFCFRERRAEDRNGGMAAAGHVPLEGVELWGRCLCFHSCCCTPARGMNACFCKMIAWPNKHMHVILRTNPPKSQCLCIHTFEALCCDASDAQSLAQLCIIHSLAAPASSGPVIHSE